MTLAALSFRAIWVIVCAKIRSEINATYLLTETSRSRLLCLVNPATYTDERRLTRVGTQKVDEVLDAVVRYHRSLVAFVSHTQHPDAVHDVHQHALYVQAQEVDQRWDSILKRNEKECELVQD